MRRGLPTLNSGLLSEYRKPWIGSQRRPIHSREFQTSGATFAWSAFPFSSFFDVWESISFKS